MKMEEILAAIERAPDLRALRSILQALAQNLGFSGFNFIDAGSPENPKPFYMGTVETRWELEYVQNNFVLADPVLSKARRINLPFSWGSIRLPSIRIGGGRRSIAQKTMEAAKDHGFTEGFVIPFHFRDALGRVRSCCTCFFWKDPLKQFAFRVGEERHNLHLVMLYWSQRVVSLVDIQSSPNGAAAWISEECVSLSDRERDVLAWAARGRTGPQTAEILGISNDTVEFYVRNAMSKLDAATKTHAVAKAVFKGLIDI